MKKTITTQTIAPTEARTAPSHDEISRRARELWEKYGQPAGRDEEIWFEAERQLLAGDPKARKPAAARSAPAPIFAQRASA